ncbi:hypothetical protein D3C72_2131320 [compost metagenome]
MQKITAGTASASTSGTSRGRKAAKMLAYTTAVFGLLICVARPSRKVRPLRPWLRGEASVSGVIASGWRAPRQMRKPR